MIVLQIALVLAYFVLTSWLVIATFLNFLLKPYKYKGNYTVSSGVSWGYAVLWGLVLTTPVGYGLIVG